MTGIRRAVNISLVVAAWLMVSVSGTLAHRAGVRGTQVLHVANEGSNTISVIDVESKKVAATIPVGAGPQHVAISPDRRYAFVTCGRSRDVWIPALPMHTVVAVVPDATGSGGQAVFGYGGTYAYVTNSLDSRVTVIEIATGKKVALIPLGKEPSDADITPSGDYIYITNMGSNDVSVISTRTSAVGTIPVGARPHDIVLSGDGRYAFVANTGSDDISVINLLSQEGAGRIPVGKQPSGIALW